MKKSYRTKNYSRFSDYEYKGNCRESLIQSEEVTELFTNMEESVENKLCMFSATLAEDVDNNEEGKFIEGIYAFVDAENNIVPSFKVFAPSPPFTANDSGPLIPKKEINDILIIEVSSYLI